MTTKLRLLVVVVVALLATHLTSVQADGHDDDHQWSGDSSKWTISSNSVVLQVVGQSGAIRLRRYGEDEAKNVEVKLDKLTEFDANGNKVQQSQLGQSTFNWNIPSRVLVNGVNVTRVALNGTLSVRGTSVPITMQVDMYETTTTVTWGNQTFTVYKDNAKFTITLGAWPFSATTNNLRLDLDFVVSGSSEKPTDDDDNKMSGSSLPSYFQSFGDDTTSSGGRGSSTGGSGDDSGSGSGRDRQRKWKLSTRAVFDVVTVAILDGVTTNITVNTYAEGSNNGLSFIFPSYKTSLEYDPVVGMSTSGVALAAVPSILALMLLAMFTTIMSK